jgi:metal-responsive CopG/Arc/MetJ family transcriptional regulator
MPEPSTGRQPLRRARAAAEADRSPRTTVQLDRELSDELDAQAAREGTTRASLTRKAVRFYLDQVSGTPTKLQVVSLVAAND